MHNLLSAMFVILCLIFSSDINSTVQLKLNHNLGENGTGINPMSLHPELTTNSTNATTICVSEPINPDKGKFIHLLYILCTVFFYYFTTLIIFTAFVFYIYYNITI